MASMPRVALIILVLCPAAIGQAQEHRSNEIVLQGLIEPEVETLSLTASCFSRTFAFALANRRLGPSALTDARLDGRPPRNPDSLAGLRQFLGSARKVHFAGVTCVSASEISIGLSGLLFAPPPGRRDDILRVFRIRF